MARKRYELTERKLKTLKPGRHADGGSLFLRKVSPNNQSWETKYSIHGRQRWMGLGSYPEVSLKEARELRDEAHKLVRAGIDPIIARDQSRQKAATSLTVMQAAEAWIAVMSKGWGTLNYPGQIRARLKKYVAPHIGHLGIGDIGLPEIKRVLMPVWVKMKSADQIRENLEAILNWSLAEGHRDDARGNPARELRYSMPTIERRVVHYPSLEYGRAPDFMAELRKLEGARYRALELVMLTVVRTADICGGGKARSTPMRWTDVDMPSATWVVPDTKTNKSLTVPLSEAAMNVLAGMQRFRDFERFRISRHQAQYLSRRFHNPRNS